MGISSLALETMARGRGIDTLLIGGTAVKTDVVTATRT